MPDSEQKEFPGTFQLPAAQEPSEGDDSGEFRYGTLPSHGGISKGTLFIFVLVLAALAALASFASHWKKEVDVRDVVVEGVSPLVVKELLSCMNVYKGRNLQELDAEEIRAKLMRFPYVRDAVISKELNGVIRIRVVERVPLVVTVINGNVMVVDTEGFLLPGKKEFSGQPLKLLAVSGITRLKAAGNGLQHLDRRDVEMIRQFLEALAGSDYAHLLIRELHLAANNMSYCIAVQAPTRFIVGSDGNFKEKLKKFEIFWHKVISKKGYGSYETVDLRFSDRVFTRDTLSLRVKPQSPL